LKELWFRDKAYNLKRPSIDRKNNNEDYTFENCRFIELGKNTAERNARVSPKPVNQYDLQGNFIKMWHSMTEVEIKLGFANPNISSACSGRYKQAYGFIWKFKK